ncbi:extracellular solute-binding protein [Paenibacillus sp. GD4]|jgi:multiple sugar transport system substrate-binding protein|uniref:ABC transporter substrate-binding protein n=1 Tax=Paenibacillus sp. GD4 TaxID=3068890 RepID=UPI002796702A|nr:extracellular solute-binding protein [Paenibacillus sp. GD4]MDQ1912699.1 extracellular solute-binding protein [Paenibacillus sp. GD4]
MKFRYHAALIATAVLSFGWMAGCTNGGGAPSDVPSEQSPANPQQKQEEPVKLLMAQKWSEITEADFQSLIVEPLKKKYPHIEIEMLKGENIKEMIAAGTVPDLVATWVNLIPDYQDLDLVEDQTPLMKKHNLDANRFDSVYLDTIRGYNPSGLVALPYDANFNVLYYNKDIFDKFGVEYPKDGMTWEETIALAKRVSREDQGVRYRGLDTDGHGKLALQIALPAVKDGNSNVNNEQWKRILELQYKINTIPFNEGVPNVHQRNQFIKDRTLAMFATGNNLNLLQSDAAKGLNWDMAQYPVHPDQPEVAGMVDQHVMFVTKQSKHKDAAFKVIETITSDEIQKKLTRASGKMSVLKEQSIRKELGADMPVLQGKHTEAIFKGRYIPAYTATNKYPDAGKFLNEAAAKYFQGEQDVNTALRTADEAIQNHIRQVDAATGKK